MFLFIDNKNLPSWTFLSAKTHLFSKSLTGCAAELYLFDFEKLLYFSLMVILVSV